MKLRALLVGVVVLLCAASPATARTTKPRNITFETTVSCGAACPHWQSPSQPEAFAKACEKTPLTVPGSWDEIRLTVPKTIGGRRPYGLIFELRPALEYDGFACRVSNAGRSNERYTFVATAANKVSENCTALFFGCVERAAVPVKPGQIIVLRAINWLDGPTCPGSYRWLY